ncbi:saccharopine dehydrogenase [Pseudomonas alcaligenes]|uniref:Saccharopine dehydrogenase n=1 Tax=Aquipseudomonas alcaligenes TaxID=43263 RepID=A0ABR7S2I6_AQUAC|nr:saccharopine dehydrogenase NADP-binding domain-containing protein [Pseudomonas alcaligenes]MBC9250937.1 saccharopine dehydrogenase [Pseudomonas alcaligenes]
MTQPQFDIVVFGATSFVGQILCEYLWQRHGLGGEVKWALAGRSQSKLQQIRAALGADADGLPLLIADADDEAALRALCDQTEVVISTVGPYSLYGSTLVKVCAETGTDYCDLTGEVQWMARMIAKYEATAQKSGARIVHCCGFDSVPSDLGVQFLQEHAQQRFGQTCNSVRLRIKSMRGTLSGGTVASMLSKVDECLADPSVAKVMEDPFALCPIPGVYQPDVKTAQYDDASKSWAAPFIMAIINTRVVHRSNHLTQGLYGSDFRYDETMMTGSGISGRVKAVATASGLSLLDAALAWPPTRWLFERFGPKPGDGPSPEAQRAGFYDFIFFGRTADDRRLDVRVTGDRDPGYGSTSKMLGEAGVCLAFDLPKADHPGGFWTPATLMGGKLRHRLVEHAGLTFEVVR